MNKINNNTIGINNFVKRQIKGSGKTYSTLSFKSICSHAQEQLKKGIFKKGYRDGVILIPICNTLLEYFICPIVKINMNTRFESIPKKRRNDADGVR